MVVDESITTSLNRIADNQEEMIDVLKRIANHYDGVVPVMTRNAKRAESLAEESEKSLTDTMRDNLDRIFSPTN